MKPLTWNQAYRSFRGRTILSKPGREFKKQAEMLLQEYNSARDAFLEDYDPSIHGFKFELFIGLPNCLTKKGLISKTAGDEDNFIKLTKDSVFKWLEVDDSQVLVGKQSKFPSEVPFLGFIVSKINYVDPPGIPFPALPNLPECLLSPGT